MGSPIPGTLCKMSCIAVVLRVPLTGPVRGTTLSLTIKFLTSAVLEDRLLTVARTLTWRSLRMVATASSRQSSATTLLLLEELLWVWLLLSWPSSPFLVALERGWAIHLGMSDSWAASMRVEYGKLSDLYMFIQTVSNLRSFDLRSDSSSM